MTKRISVALTTILVFMSLAFPVFGQSAKEVVLSSPDLAVSIKDLQSNPLQLEAAYKLGNKVAVFCANCHGNNGNSVKPDIPNLAGQNPLYLLEQMRQFSSGERHNEFMEGLIKALKSQEKVSAIIYFSSQEVLSKPAGNTALATKGQNYYSKNCISCHGEQGRGNDKMARIAGQQPNYLSLALKHYRDGSNIRRDALMAASTQQMTDADIAAVVAYITAMK